jgi:catechol 2,3-dioxygenase-like lactoylglutathione lyase family enzyme
MELHRGRMIDHVHLVVGELEASRRFYRAVLSVLGIGLGGEGKTHFWADELFVSTADSRHAQGQRTGRVHLAFQAPNREAVDAFHRAGLESGGRPNGEPGLRPYHPGYYAAFLLDPDGNNIEAVYHGPHERSAESVVIRF